MEAINTRLRQLENIEAKLYNIRQATIQRRSCEDEGLSLSRQSEDHEFLRTLDAGDKEEDVGLSLNPRILID